MLNIHQVPIGSKHFITAKNSFKKQIILVDHGEICKVLEKKKKNGWIPYSTSYLYELLIEGIDLIQTSQMFPYRLWWRTILFKHLKMKAKERQSDNNMFQRLRAMLTTTSGWGLSYCPQMA